MKILYHHRIASKDGQYVHVSEIIDALRSQGHEVLVVEPGATTEKEFGESSSFVSRLRRYLPGFLHELAEFLYSVNDYRKLVAVIKAFQPDVIYERYNLFFPSGIWAAKKFELPLILEVNAPLYAERSAHGGLSLGWLARWSERYVWTSADRVLPVTGVLAEMIEASGVDDSKLTVIANGVNRAEFSRPDSGDLIREKLNVGDRRVLGFTGFVRDWHKLDRVIDHLPTPELSNWHLVIVGDGPVCGDLRQQAEQLGVADRVSFCGIVPREQIRSYVSAFDIALQPDVVDYASPLKLFEYMALGKAVIAPNKANIREVLTDDENALLFDVNSDDDFSHKLLAMCEQEHERLRLGGNAKTLVERMGYYWDENAKKIVAMADSLLRPD